MERSKRVTRYKRAETIAKTFLEKHAERVDINESETYSFARYATNRIQVNWLADLIVNAQVTAIDEWRKGDF